MEVIVRRLRAAVLVALVATLAFSSGTIAAPRSTGGHLTDGTTTRPTVDRAYALVQLQGAPVTTSEKTRPAPGRKLDFNNRGVRAYRAELSALRNEFKQWLRQNAPKASVSGEFDISLHAVSVKLNGTSLAKLREAPMAVRAEHQRLYYPTAHQDPDLALVNALAAWNQSGGAANAGAGVKVAIVDSGIDVGHPCFNDSGYPSQVKQGPPALTNNKVIVAKVFNNKAKSRGYTPEAVDSHGTHVAGTVACNLHTPAVVDGVAIPYAISGVAPRALLGNYNVFPGTVESARSEDILNALDAAYADGMDIINMSLGGDASGIQDLLTMAVDNLDLGNVVVAVSAGNEGPGHYTVGSPGSAARALTAGASDVGHGMSTTFSVGGETYDAVPGQFGSISSDLTAPVAILTSAPVNAASGYSEACSALPANSLTGRIAIIGRGTCDFSTKVRYVELAGAVGAIVVNREAGVPFIMGQGASPDGIQPTIPAYMISLADGIAVRTAEPSLEGSNGTMTPPAYYRDAALDNVQADFSSQGPTDVDFRVKPDLMAPGGNVLSSVVGDCAGGCFAFFSGTSMAAPHLAGAAAFLRGANPSWSAAEIRSAIVNTAARGVVTKWNAPSTVVTDVNVVGAGLLDLEAAGNASAAIGPVSTSFGSVPRISGHTRTAPVTITNLTGAPASWSLSVTGTTGTGVAFTVSPSVVNLAAGATATVTVTMSAAKGASAGGHQAFLQVGSVAHSVLYVFVK
jgi:minor extracellular serine protease Vpr